MHAPIEIASLIRLLRLRPECEFRYRLLCDSRRDFVPIETFRPT
jgi:hypothetical protein